MEKIFALLFLLFVYSIPLIIACLGILLYRKVVDKDSYSRDFISGLIFLVGIREMLRNMRPRRR